MATPEMFKRLFGKPPMVAKKYIPELAEEYLSIPLSEAALDKLILDYVKMIETSETTTDNCTCQWIIHPDDINKPKKQRRLRRGVANLRCPAHTKEGFLLGFVGYLKNHG